MVYTRYFLLLLSSLMMIGCSDSVTSNKENKDTDMAKTTKIEIGGLYASKGRDGKYLVTKVLACDDVAVHVRIYANKYSVLPMDLDSSTLSLGSLNDKGGFGIGHAPMAKDGFWLGSPILLKVEAVRENELDGYKMYLDAMKR